MPRQKAEPHALVGGPLAGAETQIEIQTPKPKPKPKPKPTSTPSCKKGVRGNSATTAHLQTQQICIEYAVSAHA